MKMMRRRCCARYARESYMEAPRSVKEGKIELTAACDGLLKVRSVRN